MKFGTQILVDVLCTNMELFSGFEVKVKVTPYFDLENFSRPIFMKFGTQIVVDVLSTNM